MIDVRRKVGAAVAVVSLCAMVGVGGLIGCAPQATPAPSTGGDAPAPAAAESTTEESAGIASGNLDKWAEQFPLQYNSYHQSPVKADGKHHGHYDLKAKLFAPVVRDGSALITTNEDGTTDTNGDGMYQISGFHYDEASHQWVIDEDDITTLDEEIGVKLVCFDHDEVEFAHTSPMAELGVDCVTCHMPQSIEGGTTYTNHHASGSPLENPDSLAKCLECHESQGIKTADEMVKMVRDKQADATATYEAVKAKLDQAYDLLAAKTAAGTPDADLAEVRTKYQTADGYLQHIRGGNNGMGTKVVHNAPQFYDLAAKADVLCDEMIAALS